LQAGAKPAPIGRVAPPSKWTRTPDEASLPAAAAPDRFTRVTVEHDAVPLADVRNKWAKGGATAESKWGRAEMSVMAPSKDDDDADKGKWRSNRVQTSRWNEQPEQPEPARYVPVKVCGVCMSVPGLIDIIFCKLYSISLVLFLFSRTSLY
jgi:hypothetical protein